jgi:glycerol kinase
MQKYILSIDQGTTSSRSLLVDHDGKVVATAQKEFTQIFPNAAWVEHDANEIWQTQIGTIHDVLKKASISAEQIAAIGITNQRETVVIWDKHTGVPLCNAIVWQDRRTSAYCDSLNEAGHQEMIKSKTGLIIDAYFSASKIKWVLDNVEGAREKANQGLLAAGTIDSWLIYNLSKGQLHITDVSNASRTMLFNIHTLQWDDELLALFDIPIAILPDVKSSSEIYGKAFIDDHAIPLSGIAGDQQAALFGQLCLYPGMVKNTYGTGCFMLMNTGDKAITSHNNLLTTIAWKINGKTVYALEGSVFISGAVVQWLRDGMKIIINSQSIENLAKEVPDNDGVYFVPAFTGLGAPYWNQNARGSIFGLTRGSTRAHIARAALESVGFQTYDVLKSMQKDADLELALLKVDGGASNNSLLMQIQSDLVNCDVAVPENKETTAMGAAYLAGLAIGYWSSIDEIENFISIENIYKPSGDQAKVASMIKNWHRAVRAAISWANDNDH